MERIALIFPGQGSQYIGMGKQIFDQHEQTRKIFEEANEVLNFDLTGMCFEGSILELSRPENMFPAIVMVSVATFVLYQKLIGIPPKLCAGHSLGEYSALVCSGAVSFADALKIVRKRGFLASEVSDSQESCMTVVEGMDKYILEEICQKASNSEDQAVISCYNSIDQFVIAGNSNAVWKTENAIMEMGGTITPVLTSAPFHSFLMSETSQKLREELSKYEFKNPQIPVVSNVNAMPYQDSQAVEMLVKQMVSPVLWKDTMDYFRMQRINVIIEMGPQNVLRNLARNNIRTVRAYSFSNTEDRNELINYVFSEREQQFKVVEECMKVAASLPNSNWNNKEYSEKVAKPYKLIEKIRFSLIEESRKATKQETKEVLILLKEIMDAKRISAEEQCKAYKEILTNSGLELEVLPEGLGMLPGEIAVS